MHELGIGKLITRDQQRDAIHVAIAPVIAGYQLAPGQRVTFVEGSSEVVVPGSPVVGIIDPFLDRSVLVEERCWLFLLPNTVTGMRHEWQHPSFTAKDKTPQMHQSEMWLRVYAGRYYSHYGQEEAFERLIEDLRSREICYRGTEMHGFHDLEDADRLKEHAEAYLGIQINWGDYTFTCSC